MDEILKCYQEILDALRDESVCEGLYQKIQNVIQEIFDGIPDNARIAIRGGREYVFPCLCMVNISEKRDICIFNLHEGDQILNYPCRSADKLMEYKPEYVISCNFTYRDEIREELKAYSNSVVIDIYEELELKGFELTAPIHLYLPECPMALNYFYIRYQKEPENEAALRDFLCAALEQKDFVMLRTVYNDFQNRGSIPEFFENTWRKVQQLLKLIQDKIEARSRKDIIIFWTDALPYSDLKNMPALQKMEDAGFFFERTYTSTPYTEATAQAMFCRRHQIDDYPESQGLITRENSALIQYLENHGYDFCWFTSDRIVDAKYCEKEKLYSSNTIIAWHGLERLLSQQKPCFYIFHFAVETHSPVISPNVGYIVPNNKHFTQSEGRFLKTPEMETQRETALRYLDQCLTLYNYLLRNKIHIFLSDHGWDHIGNKRWSEDFLHSYCLAIGEGIPKKRISEIFSYINFDKFIYWILEPEKNPIENALTDKAIFCDLEFYSARLVNQCFKYGMPKAGLAYRGVIYAGYKYVINSIGEEFFYKLEDNNEVRAPSADEALLQEMRTICGTHFADPREYEQFKYALETYKRIYEANPAYSRPLWLAKSVHKQQISCAH